MTSLYSLFIVAGWRGACSASRRGQHFGHRWKGTTTAEYLRSKFRILILRIIAEPEINEKKTPSPRRGSPLRSTCCQFMNFLGLEVSSLVSWERPPMNSPGIWKDPFLRVAVENFSRNFFVLYFRLCADVWCFPFVFSN